MSRFCCFSSVLSSVVSFADWHMLRLLATRSCVSCDMNLFGCVVLAIGGRVLAADWTAVCSVRNKSRLVPSRVASSNVFSMCALYSLAVSGSSNASLFTRVDSGCLCTRILHLIRMTTIPWSCFSPCSFIDRCQCTLQLIIVFACSLLHKM